MMLWSELMSKWLLERCILHLNFDADTGHRVVGVNTCTADMCDVLICLAWCIFHASLGMQCIENGLWITANYENVDDSVTAASSTVISSALRK